jgi:hypothetical protein
MKVPALVVVPVVLVAVAGVGLYPSTPCACAHPFVVLIGPLQPLDLTDGEIRTRIEILARIGASDGITPQTLLEPPFGRYCKQAAKSIACEPTFKESMFGMRRQGLTLTFALDASGRVAGVEVSRFSRWE